MPPPEDADDFPTDAERASAVAWIRTSLDEYDAQHAGEPGRITVRRLTSAEYAYAIRDLTGIDIRTGIDASSDSVGGEGFANFGDVQSVQDTTVEHYLEAAKQIADHAVIGSGPLAFYADSGDSGLELSALDRIDHLYATRGFRVVSGEGGRPFGFERYAKAFYVAWYLQASRRAGRSGGHDPRPRGEGRHHRPLRRAHVGRRQPDRRRLPEPRHDRGLAGDSARRRPTPRPRWPRRVPTPRRSPRSWSTWPSWFFARGDLAAGGAGDESPLRVRRHHADRRAEARLHLRAQPALRPADARPDGAGRSAARRRTVDRPPDVRRAAQGRRHAGRRSGATRASCCATPASLPRPVRAGGHHRAARARADPEDVPAAATSCRRPKSRACASA